MQIQETKEEEGAYKEEEDLRRAMKLKRKKADEEAGRGGAQPSRSPEIIEEERGGAQPSRSPEIIEEEQGGARPSRSPEIIEEERGGARPSRSYEIVEEEQGGGGGGGGGAQPWHGQIVGFPKEQVLKNLLQEEPSTSESTLLSEEENGGGAQPSQSPEIVREDNAQVAIDAERLISMEKNSNKWPKLLNINGASISCSIFRVPTSIMKLHPESFKPALVSIGPYYHGEKHLQMIEEHKWPILRCNLNRSKEFNVTLDVLFKAIAIKEVEIRECYSENIDQYDRGKLIEMMILDGGFIIELLCVINGIVLPKTDHPVFRFPWMLRSLARDLLMLENQIPFFVLQILYAKCIPDEHKVPPLQELILQVFSHSVSRYVDVSSLCQKYKDYNGAHILDFYRSTFLPSPAETDDKKEMTTKKYESRLIAFVVYILHFYRPTFLPSRAKTDDKNKMTTEKDENGFTPSVEKLREAGIKFKKRDEKGIDSFLEIKYKDGVLEIPCLTTTEIMSPLILNCIAFEQCHDYSSKHFTSYFNFMGHLINTTLDAQYLMETCKSVEIYYRNVWHVRCAEFRFKYCGSIWIVMSACAAVFLILLSVGQFTLEE